MPEIPLTHSWLADQPLQRKIVLAIGLLLALFLLSSAVTIHSLRQQESDRQWATHTYATLQALDHVRLDVQASQINARNFLLTQDAAQRTAFNHVIADLGSRLAALHQLLADNPLQQSRIDTMEKMAREWQRDFFDRATDPLKHMHADDPAQAALQLQHIQSDYLAHRLVAIGDISSLLDKMTAEENQLLVTRTQRLTDSLKTTRLVSGLAALFCILLGIAVIRLTLKLITRPLRTLASQLTRLSNHDHDFEIQRLDRRDEIGEITRALQIFKQISLDTEHQSWIKEQTSNISHLLLQATTHKEFGQWLTSELAPLCKAGVSLFYLYDDARQRLDLLGSYGLRLNHRSADDYMPGEGLVGQCALERKPIIIDNVPANYLQIDSGSGEALPGHLAILPLLYRDTLIGVLELAGFTALAPLHKRLLDELLPIVALSLENLNRTLSTHDLLLRTQEQAGELRISELVMRQQKEVLRDNNDALQSKTDELLEQSHRLIASEEELRVRAGELQVSNSELRTTSEELTRASQYKSEFLANMSHELRTPLNSLLILSRHLADNDSGNLDDEQVESARVIHDAGNSLLYLINDILDLSKIEAGKMALVIDALPLTELVQRIRRTFTHVAAEKHLKFTVEIEAGLPAILHTDGARLEQIANNLLSNAFKFTVMGEVSVHIGRPDDTLDIPDDLRDQKLLAIGVNDTGIGIPADKFERVFNAFEQVDAGTSRQYGGTGLGLAISRRTAQLLGGDIALQSESGRGSRFTVLLPETPPAMTKEAVNELSATHAKASPHKTSPHLLADALTDDRLALQPGKPTLLLIEDDPSFARILIDRIHRKGYLALAAADGETGLQLARQHCPDGILLDMALPKMDGLAVLNELKRSETTRTIPVHCISVTDEVTHALSRGAIGFLTKPVSREAIDQAIDSLLLSSNRPASLVYDKTSHTSGMAGRRVLLVDDDMRNLFALSRVLHGWGLQVSMAQDGSKALSLLADDSVPDLLLMDIMMPGMDGYEVIRSIRAEPRLASLPIIALTAKAMQGDREKCLAIGANDYLPKPLDLDLLAARIRTWLPH